MKVPIHMLWFHDKTRNISAGMRLSSPLNELKIRKKEKSKKNLEERIGILALYSYRNDPNRHYLGWKKIHGKIRHCPARAS